MSFQLLIHIIIFLIQRSDGQSCNTMVPANSRIILDSNTYHTTHLINMNFTIILAPFAIPGWERFNFDGITYDVDSLRWRAPNLNTGLCGPEYTSCFQGAGSPVTPGTEMNWLVSSYYETEASAIYVRVKCNNLGFPTDCRNTSQILYYQSDQNITITNSQLSQFLPADSNLTVNGVVSATFTKSEKGFYIGFFNDIPCVELNEILFYYFECPAIMPSELYSLPATLAPNATEEFVRVNISCPVGFLHRDPLRLVAECYWDGTWRLPDESVCECEAGYHLFRNVSVSCVMCPVNMYKGETGNRETCSVCPFRSSTRSLEGSSECSCDGGWYRGEGDSVSESCGQSPSAVENLRVERGADGIVSRVVWDEPSYLGNRSRSELRYNVNYYPSLTPSSEEIVGELRETEFLLISGYVVESTEYVFVVTSWNSVSRVSGVFNRVNVTVLSSFPTLLNLTYNETTDYLQWSYELYGKRDYVFEVNYTANASVISRTLNSGECDCSPNGTCTCIVSAPDLNSTQSLSFRLLINSSGILLYTNLSYSQRLPQEIKPSSNPSSPTLSIIIGIVALVLIIFVLIVCLIILVIGIILRCRKSSVHSKFQPQRFENATQMDNLEKIYQDPFTYQDLNSAVRSLTKELNHDSIKIKSVIGEGEFGQVCKGTLMYNNRTLQVAIKTLKPNSSEKSKQDFLREASAMAQFSHENVIYLYGVTLVKPIMIVTPYMENGSLDKFLIANKGNLSVVELAKICRGGARGMCYLSRIGFVHRDLAARNVLIDSDFTAKIADFGLSRETEENFYNVKSGGKIPVRWTAPEAIFYRKFNVASDVWSYGVLMWEVMSSGDIPYGDLDNYKLLEQVQQGYRLSQPEGCPPPLYQLMQRCWNSTPEGRPTFSELEEEISSMVDYNFKPKPKSRPSKALEQSPLDFTSVDDWLTYLKLERYSEVFNRNGYTLISSVWHMTEQDLLTLDIVAIGHRNKIMTSIHKANSKLSRTYSARI